MQELIVSTQTTPVELARLFDGLAPDNEVGGRPGADGTVILYVCNDGRTPWRPASRRAAISARVAIDVVLQHVDGMPGAQPLVAEVHEQLAGDAGANAGALAPPLALLARLYVQTTSAMPGSVPPRRLLPGQAGAASEHDAADQAEVTPEQRQALETLIDRLMQLPCRPGQMNRNAG